MKSSHILTAVVSLSNAVSAWPYPHSLVGPLDRMEALYRRQDNGNGNNNNNNNGGSGDGATPSANPDGSASPSVTITVPPKTGSASPSSSGDNQSDKSASVSDGSQSGKSTGSDKSNPSITPAPTSSHSVAVNPQDPVGGISMIQPNPFLGSQYYRLGETITWEWNYTYLLIPPKHINILATTSGSTYGAAPTAPFTLAANYSFAPTETFTWDTNAFTSQQFLPMGTYTLMVYDADAPGGLTATPEPGRLGLWQQFYFGLYQGEDRQDLPNSYICATCNAAGGQMERLTLSFLFGTVLVTAGSFFWFTGPLAGVI